MGQRGRGHRRGLDAGHRQSDRRRSRSPRRRARRSSITGDDAAPAGRRPRGAAGAGVDAGLRCRALSHRDAVHHPRSRQRHPEHGHVPGGPEGDRPARGAHGGAALGRRRRLLSLAQIQRAPRADADRDRDRLRAGGDVHRPAEARASTSTSSASRAALAGAPIRMVKCKTVDLVVPADAEIVIEGHHRSGEASSRKRRSARATAMWRSKPTTCRCR